MSHSGLNKQLAEDVNRETGMEKVIESVATFRRRPSAKGIYELKKEFYDQYNVFFYHYSREEQSKVRFAAMLLAFPEPFGNIFVLHCSLKRPRGPAGRRRDSQSAPLRRRSQGSPRSSRECPGSWTATSSCTSSRWCSSARTTSRRGASRRGRCTGRSISSASVSTRRRPRPSWPSPPPPRRRGRGSSRRSGSRRGPRSSTSWATLRSS